MQFKKKIIRFLISDYLSEYYLRFLPKRYRLALFFAIYNARNWKKAAAIGALVEVEPSNVVFWVRFFVAQIHARYQVYHKISFLSQVDLRRARLGEVAHLLGLIKTEIVQQNLQFLNEQDYPYDLKYLLSEARGELQDFPVSYEDSESFIVKKKLIKDSRFNEWAAFKDDANHFSIGEKLQLAIRFEDHKMVALVEQSLAEKKWEKPNAGQVYCLALIDVFCNRKMAAFERLSQALSLGPSIQALNLFWELSRELGAIPFAVKKIESVKRKNPHLILKMEKVADYLGYCLVSKENRAYNIGYSKEALSARGLLGVMQHGNSPSSNVAFQEISADNGAKSYSCRIVRTLSSESDLCFAFRVVREGISSLSFLENFFEVSGA